ncbi:ABC transporter ATP-binding protein [Natronobacterium gregoryi]|uniref:ABC transporter ATP-binding protein n=2 Tax=Natronobacterium gregoryi TaxID=44930 RepID=L0AKD6_NATGS|nr:ABC transporter ATP-binding protein [Natronobacterium gregoryi]AFZ74261.1 ABC-type multidrug transport system, ATPase component [Natronobacterium gregoryi SP2]ELY63719.1 ABC-type transport system ATP-binding protein [Natronobacterium gregoryi SP2]PLK21956.1 ABC transporter ATP-binding protein [Natronobacterium gregoryi SP2]SFI52562.1 heme exporter protein A [Natronobacterium gregoryi]
MAFVSVSGVTKRFGTHVGVDDVSVGLEGGETAVLFGANGAGKTTLIRMLASLSRPTEGEIEIGSEPLVGGNAAVRSRLGVVAHETMLYEELTARENLRLHARLHGVDAAVCDDLLETVGLADRGGERVAGFSHGMSKRVSLARALVHDPDLLLFDEPYTGLDQTSLKRVAAVLEDLEDRTVLAATHDLERGYRLADRVLFMNDGRLVGDLETTVFDDAAEVLEEYERRCTGGEPRAVTSGTAVPTRSTIGRADGTEDRETGER